MTPTAEQLLSVDLETKCTLCAGRGGDRDYDGWRDCTRSGGSGYVPTEVGKRLLSLIGHNFRSLERQSHQKD